MTDFWVSVYWISVLIIAYTYFGYPLLLWGFSRLMPRPVRKGTYEPHVSVILSAFNEEKVIEKKIMNLLNMDYPAEKLEILVGSDGAFDRTDDIVSKFRSPRVSFYRFVENMGKPNVLSALAEEARGSILVFTDARQEFDREAIRALIGNFEDPLVGCVSGELCFFGPGVETGTVGKGMGVYWRYEKFLRKRESEIGSMLGATGAIYAIRKVLFPDLPADIWVDDMYIPLSAVERGFRVVFEADAKAFDRVSSTGSQEFKRKVRTLAGNFQIFAKFPQLFIPFRSPVWWQLFSHKFLRLMVPFFLAFIFIANLFLLSFSFYQFSFLLQGVFYAVAALEAMKLKGGEGKGAGYIPYTFCLLNFCAVVGFYRYLTGRQKTAWEKAYA